MAAWMILSNRLYWARCYPKMTRCPMLARLQQALGIVYISGGGMCPGLRSGRCRSCGKRWKREGCSGWIAKRWWCAALLRTKGLGKLWINHPLTVLASLGSIWKSEIWPTARDFSPDEAIFSQEYFVYCKGKWRTAGGKDPLLGHVDGSCRFNQSFLKNRAAPHTLTRSLIRDFCSNSNGKSGAKIRLIPVFNKTVKNRFIRLLFQQPAA